MPHESNPWVDFRYGSNYASTFGLLRVSGGNRYNENLIPTLNDKTAEIPGGDGMYYFNSYYKQKQFNINFAYDHLTETQLRAVRNWLNGKEIQELEFDERPGRIYFAKVTGAPSFKYIPFDQYEHSSNNTDAAISTTSNDSVLIYKGEGSVTFTCYDPYAYSDEITASISSNTSVTVEGDLPTNFTINFLNSITANTTITLRDISVNPNVVVGEITLIEGGNGVVWNGRTGLISGSNGPLKFTGNSMVMIEPGSILTVTNGSGSLVYRKRYY